MVLRKLKLILFVGMAIVVVAVVWRWIAYPAVYTVDDTQAVSKIVINYRHQNIMLQRLSNGEWCIDNTTKKVSEERLDDMLFLLQNLVSVAKVENIDTDTLPVFEIETYDGIFPLSKFSIVALDNKTFVSPHSLFTKNWYAVELLNHSDVLPIDLLSTESSFWIDTKIFDDPQKITGIEVKHYNDSLSNFSLPLVGQDLLSGIKDSTSLYQYLSYFANLSVEYYIQDTSIITTPCYSLKIYMASDTLRLWLYPHRTDPFKGYLKSSQESYVGIIAWNVFDLLLYPDFLPPLK